jgi:hypothetical protein
VTYLPGSSKARRCGIGPLGYTVILHPAEEAGYGEQAESLIAPLSRIWLVPGIGEVLVEAQKLLDALFLHDYHVYGVY